MGRSAEAQRSKLRRSERDAGSPAAFLSDEPSIWEQRIAPSKRQSENQGNLHINLRLSPHHLAEKQRVYAGLTGGDFQTMALCAGDKPPSGT